MGAAIDQGDARPILAAEAVLQFGRQFEPGCATTDNDDVARRVIDHVVGSDVGSRRPWITIALHPHFKKYGILWSSIEKFMIVSS